MLEVNEAYSRLDIGTITRIFNELENGLEFIDSDTIDSKERLNEKLINIKNAIEKIEFEIAQVVESEDYEALQEIDDVEEYFKESKAEFEHECVMVSNELESKYALDFKKIDIKAEQSGYSEKILSISPPSFER
ncbi:MAG: hypothetical protein Q9M40_10940 [Sulfurimonas sp.]|nr:hypothetical protein [Sulfurimonas sp.]